MYEYKYTYEEISLHVFDFHGSINQDDVNNFKSDFLKILEKRELFYFIVNISNISCFELRYFLSVRNFIHSYTDIVKNHLGASSIIVSSRFSGILNMAMKLKKTIAPYYISSDIESSVQFLINIHQGLQKS